jgi:hypothetical protein
MKHLKAVFALVAISALATSLAQAQATRTWVSGVGDDANPCSRTAPCKTFPGAFSKTAPGGEIDVLDPGGFGAITITKSITIDGGGFVAGVLVSGTNGIVVAAGPHDVVNLRNLDIDGLGTGLSGILVNSGGTVHIEHCLIYNFVNNGIDIQDSNGGQIFVTDTTSRGNLSTTGPGFGAGLNIAGPAYSSYVSVSNSHFDHNTNGVYAGALNRTTVTNSTASGNTGSGFIVNGGTHTATLNVINSSANENLGPALVSGGGTGNTTLRVSNVSMFGNASGISILTTGKVDSFGNNASDSAPATTTPATFQ